MNGRTSTSFKMTCRTCFTDTTGDTLYAIDQFLLHCHPVFPPFCRRRAFLFTVHWPTIQPLRSLSPSLASFPPPPSKLDVYTVAERDLFMGDLAHNPQFRASIPPPSKETLVLVAGPEYFTAKVVDYLTKSG